jgi:hypothetical protein
MTFSSVGQYAGGLLWQDLIELIHESADRFRLHLVQIVVCVRSQLVYRSCRYVVYTYHMYLSLLVVHSSAIAAVCMSFCLRGCLSMCV